MANLRRYIVEVVIEADADAIGTMPDSEPADVIRSEVADAIGKMLLRFPSRWDAFAATTTVLRDEPLPGPSARASDPLAPDAVD